MFRHSLLVLLVVAAGCCIVNAAYFDQRSATKDDLEKQKKLYKLTWHPSQPEIVNPELYQLGLDYQIEKSSENYTNKTAYADFMAKLLHGMMHRGEIFTPFYPKLLEECKALFRLFYYAKDFDTFFKTAAWARVHVNEGQFMYALYSAVFRREDTKWMKLPPHYEMYPYAYYNSDVLTRARFAKRVGQLVTTKESDGYDTYVIRGPYTSWYQVNDHDLEHKLNYFTEDIEWNLYYFYFRQEMPFWMKSEEFNFPEYRGEEYLYVHKQLLNRYYLERLSHGIPLFEDFDWHREFPVGYYPVMVYHNGYPYPQRPANSHFPDYKYKYIEEIQHFESRVADAIDGGHMIAENGTKIDIFTREGLSMLGNIIEGNEDSINPNYYGSIDRYARKILGFNLEPSSVPHNLLPSALESFSTSMRDPASYRLYKKIVGYYQKYKSHLKPYREEEFVFPSLRIESFKIDPLITYFDEYDSVVSNGMPVENRDQSDSVFVKIRQYRLNHVPFHYSINIQSTEDTQAVLRVFLGPKQDTHHRDMQFDESYQYFYELEHDIIQLKTGLNEIERICNNSVFTTDDEELGEKFYLKLKNALSGGTEFQHKQRVYGFPLRLILPRGNAQGMPFQLFVYVNPINSEPLKYKARIWGEFNMDNKPFGFPLDRPPAFDFRSVGYPNMLTKDVVIVHKEHADVVF